ncbi:GIY-YIG nuclease family protein [Chryseobacterium sp. SNU WT5]|uniref:GIY-YIG nuclease family protein n=1 Tax=Chryseobacterium sp. SNU WT5 TaxID=2594269 RepID=UPI00117E9B1F|nr:GIY-YIG nuclease family protein [Chryseobacterium sp. SNU WT5]QDP84323.1 GIY-YIG nuclease family protein [Chryseobacterium sp. SNU WT5]
MNHFVYILILNSSKSFYIGETEDMEQRLVQHNAHFFKNSYTQKHSDWEIYHLIHCENRTQARKIEHHIKKMKSRKYIENLKQYPEITVRLLEKFHVI